ncbi:MAG: hypothetical protein ATN31_11165 [Candidatus Epulonipiscioides saccharophilum]|nr:MAG: hypothetical protein ATN31_11165 [Epulopiscium sp. AS2M-Bin001]
MGLVHVFEKEVPDNFKDSISFGSISEAIQQASSGDTILIHEGVYRETVNIETDNITIKNFENDYVLVTGLDIIDDWKLDLNHPTAGVKVAKVPQAWNNCNLEYTQVFINGNMGDMARHPNRTISSMMDPMAEGSGYGMVSNVYKKVNEPASVTFEEDLPNVDLAGGIFRGLIGKNRQYPLGKIVANENNTVKFEAVNKTLWRPEDEVDVAFHKFGFAMVMHKNLIDIPGEWFLEGENIYYLPKSDNETVEMQMREKVLTIQANNITLAGIHFKAGNVNFTNSNNCNITGCSFRYLYPFWLAPSHDDVAIDRNINTTGIFMENCSYNKFEEVYVAHTWGTGIVLAGGTGNSFKNCIIEDMGWLGILTSAIFTLGDETLIQNCTFRDTARFQIRIRNHGKTDIIHNEFIGAMSMSEDAGAISAESFGWIGPIDMKGSEIAYNKIHDVKGLLVSGGGYLKQFMVGLYLEDVENYTAHHNLIYNIVADNCKKDIPGLVRSGAMLYMGPRYNAMNKTINFFNNTAWNVDKIISLWDITMANYDELKAEGMEQEEKGGLMADGHFINNIFPVGLNVIQCSAMNVNMEGHRLSNVPGPGTSLNTCDVDEFFAHCAKLNYHFNPQHNFAIDSGEDTFVDVAHRDFRLKETSPAFKGGLAIPGITSSEHPDAGALEGDCRVLTAGSTLKIPIFKEIK